MDLDPQCNLTIFSLEMDEIQEIWEVEDDFVDDFSAARDTKTEKEFKEIIRSPRSIHFVLKPAEDGTADLDELSPPVELTKNVHLLPGRLTLHLFEAKIGERWSGIYQGDPLAIRTGTRVRTLAYEYAKEYGYDIVIFDTSPSLGALNRNLLTLADGFMIPCSPDLFSVYGIRNIGNALSVWRKQFHTIFQLLSDAKRENFPKQFVKLIGYTIYNAKRYEGLNELKLAKAHFQYAEKIPDIIEEYIEPENSLDFEDYLSSSMGDNSIIHSHNTFPSMSQNYHLPMWSLPDCKNLEKDHVSTIGGNQAKYRATQATYRKFAKDFLSRLKEI